MFSSAWDLFVEYDYMNFGTSNVTLNFTSGGILPANTTIRATKQYRILWPELTTVSPAGADDSSKALNTKLGGNGPGVLFCELTTLRSRMYLDANV